MKRFLREVGSAECRATLRILRGGASGLPCLITALCLLSTAHSQSNPGTYEPLHTFTGSPDGANHSAATPMSTNRTAGLLRDTQGNLYGTTSGGGASNNGTIFKVDSTGNETVLYSFKGQPDGANPVAGLVHDSAGNFYGTTSSGGSSQNGTIFKFDTSGSETVLYSFAGKPDGSSPQTLLVLNASGDLFGTTENGGMSGNGAIFKLDTSGNETVLYSFTGQADGKSPQDLLRDTAGNLYGAANSGGVLNCTGVTLGKAIGCGTVFKLDTPNTFSVMYTFEGWNPTLDGGQPIGGLVADAAGNLYGATEFGGSGDCVISFRNGERANVGCGTMFKLDTTGTETVMYSFMSGADGSWPQAGLVSDAAGNLYGTASSSIFEFDTSGRLSVLYDFSGGADGGNPTAPLLLDPAGNLYGTTNSGGDLIFCTYSGCGVVFELPATTSPVFNVVITFSGSGTGTVISSPSGINCPTDCISAFPVGTTVTLTATPTAGSSFGSWSSNCSTASNNLCTANSTQALSVYFNPPAPDFAISASAFTPAAVNPGSTASSTITTTAIASFSGSITLSCKVQSSVALAPTCLVSPASVNAGTPVTLAISTTGPTASMASHSGSGLFYAIWIPVLGLLVGGTSLTSRNQKQKARFRLAWLLAAGVFFQMACGGSTKIGSGGTPAGTYTVVVTAVSGSVQHSVNPNPTLTVQ